MMDYQLIDGILTIFGEVADVTPTGSRVDMSRSFAKTQALSRDKDEIAGDNDSTTVAHRRHIGRFFD